MLIVFTIALIPLSFAGGFALLLAVTYGWAGFGRATGRLLARKRRGRHRAAPSAFE